jgi:hypothetical protein
MDSPLEVLLRLDDAVPIGGGRGPELGTSQQVSGEVAEVDADGLELRVLLGHGGLSVEGWVSLYPMKYTRIAGETTRA